MTNISEYIGVYLKKQLKTRKLTQATFAEMVGVDERTVRRWISGDIHSLDTLLEVSKVLGFSLGDIFTGYTDY